MSSWVDEIFTVDFKNKELHVKDTDGDVTTVTRFRILYSCEDVLNSFMLAYKIDGEGLKKSSQAFLKRWGTSPTAFKKVFNSLMRQIWVNPVETFVNRYGFHKVPCFVGRVKGSYSKTAWKPSISARRVEKIWKVKEILEQSEEDGLKNVQPLLWAMEKTPSEAKKLFGKGLWKRLCKQSYTRNRAIGKLLTVHGNYETTREAVEILSKFPSRFLVRGGNSPVPLDKYGLLALELYPDYVSHKRRGIYNGDFNRVYNTITDTCRMANRLGETPNMKWSLTKWEEKHEEFSSRIELGDFSKERFPWCDEEWVDLSYTYLYDMLDNQPVEVTYELICSAWDVRNEGREQHHCVGSYAQSCAGGRYMVYQVFVDGEKHSTLGLRRSPEEGKVSFSQQYKACNGDVGIWIEAVSRLFAQRLNRAFEEFLTESTAEAA